MNFTETKSYKNNIDNKLQGGYYHNPLLVALVNSVNVDKSDLEIFFKELEKIAIGKVDETLLEEAKNEIIEELSKHPRYVFGSESILFNDFD
ncbi:MAG: type restriction enzyme, partial [Thermosipho sp. (in: thermotogales)]|nr:type restriction enzyme [Thermosipho sp. (in: thermotogales)]